MSELTARIIDRINQLEWQRDYLLGELRRIDNDPANACHIASEAISAICADEGSRFGYGVDAAIAKTY